MTHLLRCSMRWSFVIACATSLAAAAPLASAQPVTNGSAEADDRAVVAMLNANGQIICTASAIGRHTAITAAHCVAGRDPLTLSVFFGPVVGGNGITIPISDARPHPGFDPGGRDVAMLTLRAPAQAVPADLAGDVDASLVGTKFRVVGYGVTGQNNDDAGIKREGTARIASVQAEEVIAVPDPSLPCPGDSGGPLLLDSGAIAGVVSRVDSMCNDHAVYTRLDVAREVLIAPYLAETAPGTAGEGERCFYAEHCAAGLECVGDVFGETFCEAPAGCGCTSSAGVPAIWIVLALLWLVRRRRPFTRTCASRSDPRQSHDFSVSPRAARSLPPG